MAVEIIVTIDARISQLLLIGQLVRDRTGSHDRYLDMFGNPAPRGSPQSHLSADDLANLLGIIGGDVC